MNRTWEDFGGTIKTPNLQIMAIEEYIAKTERISLVKSGKTVFQIRKKYCLSSYKRLQKTSET